MTETEKRGKRSKERRPKGGDKKMVEEGRYTQKDE